MCAEKWNLLISILKWVNIFEGNLNFYLSCTILASIRWFLHIITFAMCILSPTSKSFSQRRHGIIMHLGEETKSETLSWLHRPHNGFLQDGPSLMEDDEFLTRQVKTVDMLGVSQTVKSRRWVSAVILTLVCSWAKSKARLLSVRANSSKSCLQHTIPVSLARCISWFPAPFF